MVDTKPYLIIIQATPFCNINCRYCYLPNRSSKSKISFETLRKIFSRLFEENLMVDNPSIVWHAGEPLVMPVSFYEEAFRILNEENKSGLTVDNYFQTNATLLTQDWCELIKEHNIKIGVSLDGPEFIHNASRVDRAGKGTFQQTMRGVQLLQKNEIEFSVIMVLTLQAIEYAEDIFSFFLENGITSFAFNIEEQEGVNVDSSMKHRESAITYERFFRTLQNLQILHPHIRVRELDQRRRAIIHADHVRSETSRALRILNFDHSGNFSTYCPELLTMKHPLYGDFIFGNVWNDKITDMLKNEKFIRVSEEINTGIAKCRSECEYFFVCGGGNPVNKLCENGVFASTITEYCRFSVISLTEIVLENFEEQLGLQ